MLPIDMKEHTNHIDEIAARVKQFRLDRGWTYRQMAGVITAATGQKIAPNTIRNLETARFRKPHERKLHLIEKALPGILGDAA